MTSANSSSIWSKQNACTPYYLASRVLKQATMFLLNMFSRGLVPVFSPSSPLASFFTPFWSPSTLLVSLLESVAQRDTAFSYGLTPAEGSACCFPYFELWMQIKEVKIAFAVLTAVLYCRLTFTCSLLNPPGSLSYKLLISQGSSYLMFRH